MEKFLIINTSFFGDILLTSPLCRNIKNIFPRSHITFITNKPFADAALYLDGVDKVIIYDKKGKHRGVSGALKFYYEYKTFFAEGFNAAFVIYGNERGIILSRLLGAKKVYAENNGPLRIFLSNKKIDYHGLQRVQERNTVLLEQYTDLPLKNIPMLYKPPQQVFREAFSLLQQFSISPAAKKYICLCTVSKRTEKDMPVQICAALVEKLHAAGYRILFLGAGSRAADYSSQLLRYTDKYIDLTNRTSIPLLAAVLKLSMGLISVDTGTMHLGLALGIPVLSLFYVFDRAHIAKWAPDPNLYNTIILTKDKCSCEEIFDNIMRLTSNNK
ncbi:glycosyltransferase family 9 protein [Pectinatus haikarae]|uniref:glycosyltransferase family 9 protein n=1 Tax=Pectinatus haikarae TaxID=349096 RepID=UPI0018C60865|nr:glycosyltransferase family 9 protein [Pectinatus haikarae]